jgi:hypothetical protein
MEGNSHVAGSSSVKWGRRATPELGLLGLAGALWWLAVWFHDAREFAGTYGLTPDSIGEGAILLCLLTITWRYPRRGIWRLALLAYVAVTTVGEALSIVPLPIWPWVPEQSSSHYATHALVAAAHLPLLVLAVGGVRTRASSLLQVATAGCCLPLRGSGGELPA